MVGTSVDTMYKGILLKKALYILLKKFAYNTLNFFFINVLDVEFYDNHFERIKKFLSCLLHCDMINLYQKLLFYRGFFFENCYIRLNFFYMHVFDVKFYDDHFGII